MSTANDASEIVSLPVLIVEDDPTFGKALCASLARAGIPTDWRRDGINLVSTLEGNCYQALLLDLGLPGVSGFEVLRHVRDAVPELPILIVTACVDVHARIRGLELGADDYLVKPFDPVELLARLRAVKRRRPAESRTVPARRSSPEVWWPGRRAGVEISAEEALIAGLLLALPADVPVAELAAVLHAQADTLSVRDVERCLASLRLKFGSRRSAPPDAAAASDRPHLH
jgi:DNA-binding response OmpR family regulator